MHKAHYSTFLLAAALQGLGQRQVFSMAHDKMVTLNCWGSNLGSSTCDTRPTNTEVCRPPTVGPARDLERHLHLSQEPFAYRAAHSLQPGESLQA